MMNWYDLPGALDGFENNPEFLEKLAMDSEDEIKEKGYPFGKKTAQDTCSWVKKRRYKKKMVRRFLTGKPTIVYSELEGMRCFEGYYAWDLSTSGKPEDAYPFNCYTKIFLSPRGDLRKYYGRLDWGRGVISLERKDKRVERLTNRRIRYRERYSEECRSYSYCKKLYSPKIYYW